jgi:hypothetical protein
MTNPVAACGRLPLEGETPAAWQSQICGVHLASRRSAEDVNRSLELQQ